MKWPLQIDLPEAADVSGTAYGQHITMKRVGDSLQLGIGEESWTVSLPIGAQKVVAGPALGARPFLLFPRPAVIVPPDCEAAIRIELPLHLDLAADSALLRRVAPAGLTSALYGPVDSGTLCWSVRHGEVDAEIRIANHAAKLTAMTHISCENRTNEPVEVTRVMVPADLVGLYEVDGQLQLSDITMAILGEGEAELTMEPAGGGRALADVFGRPMTPVRRAFAFSHTYRNRTGLEYGF